MHAVWGMGQMMFTKFVVVVDEHVDVHDDGEVVWRVFNNVDPERDCMIVNGPLDVLDHSAPPPATAPRWASTPPASGPRRATRASGPTRSPWSRTVVARVSARWAELGLPFS